MTMSRKETILLSVVLIILGTSMHFVHHLPCFNHFWGYIFPVVESVMAHMKMIFYPFLLLAVYLAATRRDIKQIGAPILASLAVMPLVVLAFFSYWVFVRHELMGLDMVIYIASMVGAILLAKRWAGSRFIRDNWPWWLVLAVICIILIGVLTYHAPDWIIFEDMG